MRLIGSSVALLLIACSGGDAASGDSATGQSGGGSQCSGPMFEDQSASLVAIEVFNMRAEGVWLPMSSDCIEPVPFAIDDPSGAPAPWRAPACGTCEGAVQGQCPCPPPFCDEVTALYLEPGASVSYGWSGVLHVDETIPEGCPGVADCGASCQRAVAPPDGAYTFTVQAGGATGCATEPCGCTPMDGACTLLDGGMTFEGLVDVEAVLSLPGQASVQLLIR